MVGYSRDVFGYWPREWQIREDGYEVAGLGGEPYVALSRRAAVSSAAATIGYTAQTLNEWVKKAAVDSGRRAGIATNVAERLKVPQ